MLIDTANQINWGATGDDLKAQNIANIIRTRKFEVGYLRELGLSVLDLPVNEIKGRLITEIMEQIKEFEPDATVKSIDILNADANGNLQIKVVADFD